MSSSPARDTSDAGYFVIELAFRAGEFHLDVSGWTRGALAQLLGFEVITASRFKTEAAMLLAVEPALRDALKVTDA